MRRIIHTLTCFVTALACNAAPATRAQEAAPRPDLVVRLLELEGENHVAVFVLNHGEADAPGSHLMIFGSDSSGRGSWRRRSTFGPVARGATVKMVVDISPYAAGPGTSLRAVIDSSEVVDEADETNNTRVLRVPGDAGPRGGPKRPAPTPSPGQPEPPRPPAPAEAPALSPDLAAADIQFNDKYVVGVVKNVGDRDFYAKDAKITDSFKRGVTLKRIVRVGATSHTEVIGTRGVGDARVGEIFKGAFPRPKNVPGATHYTWVLTVDGGDPDAKNDTFTKVQQVTKVD